MSIVTVLAAVLLLCILKFYQRAWLSVPLGVTYLIESPNLKCWCIVYCTLLGKTGCVWQAM